MNPFCKCGLMECLCCNPTEPINPMNGYVYACCICKTRGKPIIMTKKHCRHIRAHKRRLRRERLFLLWTNKELMRSEP